VSESWFALSREDQAEALEVAAASTGRPPHLLEKDTWVVWTLSAIYESALAEKLTFKGGTSLSKVYKIIDRFSEDVDLTYDIREVVPDLLRNGNPIPASSSQAKKITDTVRDRLPDWIKNTVQPILESAIQRDGVQATLSLAGKENEKLILTYTPIKVGTGYAASTIQLEFGGRATGEPHQRHAVACDMAPAIEGISFPTAQPLVMGAERTFWEKATAAHVYSLQGRLRGERYSRHWYDLAAMAKSGHAQTAITDLQLGKDVAEHKSMFFAEKNADKAWIDYTAAVGGAIQLVPEGGALDSLKLDYAAMLEDGLLSSNQPSFAEIIEICFALQRNINTHVE
jgi:Nucleotidyl transferase AbiEii toxin, Type IV TA system